MRRPAQCLRAIRGTPAFGSRVAFADLAGRQTNWTGDRREFLGRNGTLAEPAALARELRLSPSESAPAWIPAAHCRRPSRLEPARYREVIFFLGEAADAAERAGAPRALAAAADLEAVLRSVVERWDEVLGTVQVKTPDRSMDIILNRWMLYQTLACRDVGAIGVLSGERRLLVSRPAPGRAWHSPCRAGRLTREHLLRAAARQFIEGDVQHWWLPRTGQGVRTRISDDRIWLAFAAAHYVETTGDMSRCSTKACRSSKARRCGPAITMRTSNHRSRTKARRSSNTARARWIRASPSANTACR